MLGTKTRPPVTRAAALRSHYNTLRYVHIQTVSTGTERQPVRPSVHRPSGQVAIVHLIHRPPPPEAHTPTALFNRRWASPKEATAAPKAAATSPGLQPPCKEVQGLYGAPPEG